MQCSATHPPVLLYGGIAFAANQIMIQDEHRVLRKCIYAALSPALILETSEFVGFPVAAVRVLLYSLQYSTLQTADSFSSGSSAGITRRRQGRCSRWSLGRVHVQSSPHVCVLDLWGLPRGWNATGCFPHDGDETIEEHVPLEMLLVVLYEAHRSIQIVVEVQ